MCLLLYMVEYNIIFCQLIISPNMYQYGIKILMTKWFDELFSCIFHERIMGKKSKLGDSSLFHFLSVYSLHYSVTLDRHINELFFFHLLFSSSTWWILLVNLLRVNYYVANKSERSNYNLSYKAVHQIKKQYSSILKNQGKLSLR